MNVSQLFNQQPYDQKKYTICLVGTPEFETTNKQEALEKFRELETKGRSYGNRYLKCPDGNTINVWDLK